jgi:predicted AlkP superfamily pyrophosphatase or phosphodiesterase
MKRTRSLASLCLFLGVLLAAAVPPLSFGIAEVPAAASQADSRPVRPIPGIQRVVIISIDGLRPDLLIRAKTPYIHGLVASGASSFWARTTEVSITLPSHVSMLTGVTPEVHGITWNDDSGDDKTVGVPTVFEIAKRGGYTTAMVAGKSKFVVLAKPDTLDALSLPPKGSKDDDLVVAKSAVATIKDTQPELLMIHFPSNDSAGHQYGWGSAQQIAAVERADEAVGMVLAALDQAELRDRTLIILSADHGGQGKSHGANDVRSRHIPWIASGPGVKKNYDLNLDPKTVINTEDTFATALYVLGLMPPEHISGKPVLRAFELPAPTTAPVVQPALESVRTP